MGTVTSFEVAADPLKLSTCVFAGHETKYYACRAGYAKPDMPLTLVCRAKLAVHNRRADCMRKNMDR